MFLSRRKLVRKRSLYDFTLKRVHIYYRHLYNKNLAKAKYEENYLINLVEMHQNTSGIPSRIINNEIKTPTGKQKCLWSKNNDIPDLSYTKDMTDFDRSFLKYLNLSFKV
jgi:hypothetical protein